MAKFITIEGGDGSGKSTLLAKIENDLKSRGLNFAKTREPGGTPIAEEIRNILLTPRPGIVVSPLAELLLYEASRADHVENFIRPALARGTHVLCDRFTHSSLAYQGYGRNLGPELVKNLNHIATAGLVPDAVIWLKITPDQAKQRITQRGGQADRLESEKQSFHNAVYEAFLEISKEESSRFIVLDATRNPDEVFRELTEHSNWKKLWSDLK